MQSALSKTDRFLKQSLTLGLLLFATSNFMWVAPSKILQLNSAGAIITPPCPRCEQNSYEAKDVSPSLRIQTN